MTDETRDPRHSLRRFFAEPENIDGTTIRLDESETRHLRDVLRLRTGDEVSVFDGLGKEYRCTVDRIERATTSLRVSEEIEPLASESPLDLRVAAAVIGGDRFDLIVQKSVELGVSALLPLITIRCEMKLRDAERRMQRWRRIALEACKQSGRAKLMAIQEPAEFHDLIKTVEPELTLMFSERDGEGFENVCGKTGLTAIYGPKGGWDDLEMAAARSRQITIVTLGGRTLRAETAAIAITAILQHRFGDIK